MKAFSCQKEGFNTRERFSEKNRTDNNIFLKVLRHIFLLDFLRDFFRLYTLKLTDKKRKRLRDRLIYKYHSFDTKRNKMHVS